MGIYTYYINCAPRCYWNDQATSVAPINATILDIHVTPGEKPPPTGMMEMGDTDRMTARVEIWQDRIAAVHVGQPVELVTPALAQTLQGRGRVLA